MSETIYECGWCGWEGEADELDTLAGWSKERVEGYTGLQFSHQPAPFHACPECGEPTPMEKES